MVDSAVSSMGEMGRLRAKLGTTEDDKTRLHVARPNTVGGLGSDVGLSRGVGPREWGRTAQLLEEE